MSGGGGAREVAFGHYRDAFSVVIYFVDYHSLEQSRLHHRRTSLYNQGYIADSDLEEDEEDPSDHPADGGDNDDNESSDDDNDDDVRKDKEDEEEEHLAPANPSVVVIDDPVPSS
ncbi:hypothetical protein Tco_0054119 [Tanacetum coccineum]